jgi:hypothetical protein
MGRPAQAPLPCSTGGPIANSALLAVFPQLVRVVRFAESVFLRRMSLLSCFLAVPGRVLSGSKTSLLGGARHLTGCATTCCRLQVLGARSCLGAVFELVYHDVRKQQILRIARAISQVQVQFASQNEKTELRSAFLDPF